MTASLCIINPGLYTTLQDKGRFGYQSFGIPVSGAMDWPSLTAANILVGNGADVAGLEYLMAGPVIEAHGAPVRIALTGTEAGLTVTMPDDAAPPREVPGYQSTVLQPGEQAQLPHLRDTNYAYLAVEGGFDIPPFLGSLSTLVRAGIGGLDGRALQAGDNLSLKTEATERPAEWSLANILPSSRETVRVVLGPQEDHFTPRGIKTFLETPYTVSATSDRMGIRLEGDAIEHDPEKGSNIISDGIAAGAIQVPGNGLPIALMAERQTTGGYPKIATIISADLPALARIAPGAEVRFEAVDIETAEAARRELDAMLADLPTRLTDVNSTRAPSVETLLNNNLISGMQDAYADPEHF